MFFQHTIKTRSSVKSKAEGTTDHWLFNSLVLYGLTWNYHMKVHISNSQSTNMYNKKTYTLILITIQSNLLSFVIEFFWLKKNSEKFWKFGCFEIKFAKCIIGPFTPDDWFIWMNECHTYARKLTIVYPWIIDISSI